MPTAEVVLPIRRAFYPTLSKLNDDPVAFREAVRQTYATVAVVCCALGFGLAAVADHFVPAVLGEQWLASIPLLRWLALFGTFAALSNVLGIPIMVMGQSRLLAIRTWLQLVCLVPVVYLSTTTFGVEGAAAARAAVALAFLPIMIIAVTRVCSLRIADFLAILWRPLVAGVLMAIAISALALPDTVSPIVALIGKVSLGAMVYPVLLLLLWTIAGRPGGVESRVLQWLQAWRTRQVQPPT